MGELLWGNYGFKYNPSGSRKGYYIPHIAVAIYYTIRDGVFKLKTYHAIGIQWYVVEDLHQHDKRKINSRNPNLNWHIAFSLWFYNWK